jgi:hypothetical protein
MKNNSQNDLLSALAIFTFLGGVFLLIANHREKRSKTNVPTMQAPVQYQVKELSHTKPYVISSANPFGDSIINLN